jgi:hypothetical protein
MPRMMRLAGIAVLYAVTAALLLVAPLSASEDPAPEPATPPEVAQQPEGGAPPVTEGTVPEEAPPS